MYIHFYYNNDNQRRKLYGKFKIILSDKKYGSIGNEMPLKFIFIRENIVE